MATLTPRRLLAGLAVLGFALACGDAIGPDGRTVRLVMLPSFAEVAASEDGNPASLVDNIRVVLVSATGDTVVDRVIPWPLGQDTLRIELSLEVKGSETFTFQLEGRAGETVLFQAGPFALVVAAGSGTPQVVSPVLEYTAPGSDLDGVAITGAPVTFPAGGTTQLGAVGLDGDGGEVGSPFMIWTSLDTLAAVVDGDGLVRVKHDASRTVRIVGRVAFGTLADTVAAPISPAVLAVTAGADTIRALGFDLTLTAAGQGADGGAVSSLTVAWSSTDTGVARILDRPGPARTTLVRAVSPGAVWIIATAGFAVDSVLVIVRQTVTAAAPMPSRAIIPVDDTITLVAFGVDAGGSAVAGREVTWSATGAVTVDAGGLAHGVTAGDGEVMGEIGGEQFPARIRVTDLAVAGGTERLAVGDLHACRIEATHGDLYCWGENDQAQLGTGDTQPRPQPARVPDPMTRTTGDRFVSVAAGGFHTCAVLETGAGHQTYCWGGNEHGQLGDGTTSDRATPDVPLGGPALTRVVAGGVHSCGLTADGQAYCWGHNHFGQLGIGTTGGTEAAPTAVAGGLTFDALTAGWLHTCGLTADGTAYCWGRGEEGALGTGGLEAANSPTPVAGGLAFARVVAGAAHTCGVAAATAYCWGYNSSGQVGSGTAISVVLPTAVAFDSPTPVDDLAIGWMHGCARGLDGAVFCWGANDALQLGRIDLRVSRAPVRVFLGFLADRLGGGGTESCAVAGARTVCWGGISPDYLGRAAVTLQGPAAGTFSRR